MGIYMTVKGCNRAATPESWAGGRPHPHPRVVVHRRFPAVDHCSNRRRHRIIAVDQRRGYSPEASPDGVEQYAGDHLVGGGTLVAWTHSTSTHVGRIIPDLDHHVRGAAHLEVLGGSSIGVRRDVTPAA